MHFRQPRHWIVNIFVQVPRNKAIVQMYTLTCKYMQLQVHRLSKASIPDLHCLQYVNSLGGICRGLGSLVPRPHPREKRVWWHSADSLGFVITCCMYSWELTSNLHTKEVLCPCVEVAKDFQCCTVQVVFSATWLAEVSLQKVINVNEDRGVSQTSPDPLLVGGAWTQD